uniref:Ig-like domain-containing protein n=1 Tax=Cyprinus carpio TaxID=7962 RepID=A0A8C1UAT1_CYPCA
HGEERVDQPDKNIAELEGRSVTLQCKYKTTSSQPELFWYIQRANYFPKYILWRNKFGVKDNDDEFKDRFSATLNSKSTTVQLMIKSDSAVYYCALQPINHKHHIKSITLKGQFTKKRKINKNSAIIYSIYPHLILPVLPSYGLLRVMYDKTNKLILYLNFF